MGIFRNASIELSPLFLVCPVGSQVKAPSTLLLFGRGKKGQIVYYGFHENFIKSVFALNMSYAADSSHSLFLAFSEIISIFHPQIQTFTLSS